MYLDQDSVKETLRFVSHSHLNSLIVYDCIISTSKENLEAIWGPKELLEAMKEHHKNEGLEFFLEQEKIETFLSNLNLRMIDYMDNEAIEQKYLRDDSGRLIGRMTGNFRFICASPMT